jgi:pyridoxal phosphate enzyme (YggS family)
MSEGILTLEDLQDHNKRTRNINGIKDIFFTMLLKDNYETILSSINNDKVTLVAVSKTQPVEKIKELYDLGHRDFGENRVQELMSKVEWLPSDIRWHLIGHLQTNKVKYIAPFIHLVHSVDSLDLLKEINKQGLKNDRIIPCLLEIFIAKEDSKFGLSEEEALTILQDSNVHQMKNISIRGLMGIASNTDDENRVRDEFKGLKKLFELIKTDFLVILPDFNVLSMGMSGDYEIAIEDGSTMVRIGSAIFGSR